MIVPRLAAALGLLAALSLPVDWACAQATGERIIDREPFDRLTLDKVNENKVLLLKPVPLPDRRVPAEPKLSEKLRVRLLEDDQEYEVAWQNIEKLELYEQMVLAEAIQLSIDGKFDEAYDYFVFLFDRYPQTPGLADGRQTYLYLSAGAAFRQQKYHEALGIAEELMAQNPEYKGPNAQPLKAVLGNIADKLIEQYVAAEDYRSARTLLARLVKRYPVSEEPFAPRWRNEMIARATAKRDEARAHLDAGRFIEAYDAAAGMRAIWPDVAGGAEVAAEVFRRHPLVMVGVEHPALSFDARSLTNPAARRAGRLVERRLLEFAGPGPEGGSYSSPLGTVEQSVDGLELMFQLRTGAPLAGADLSQLLLGWARPGVEGFEPAWARTLESVAVTGITRVSARLKAPHVAPQALLQGPYEVVPFLDQPGTRGNGAFYLFSKDANLVRFNANDRSGAPRTGQLAEVGERLYTDPQRALLGLQRGEVDVLERVFPGDLPVIRGDAALAARPVTMPTTHLLLVRDKHPFLTNRTFRRALVYGSDREQILHQALMRGQQLTGFRVVSAPFPAPFASGDSQGYAYDEQITPRPYDPRLALTLRVLSQGELKSTFERQQKQAPTLTPLVLGHPADETSRIACRALAKQWDQIGIKCKLVEFPPGEFNDKGESDLIYAQIATWEPVVDAARLLGPEGAAPAKSGFVQLSLRQIERAANWQEARERFRQLHRLLHEDVSVVPLWQTYDHYAYRKSLQALDAPRVTLYENVETWQSNQPLARAGSRGASEGGP